MARGEAAATITKSTIPVIIDDIVAALIFGCMTQLSKDNGVYHNSLATNQFQVRIYGLGFSVDNICYKEYLVRDSNPQSAIS